MEIRQSNILISVIVLWLSCVVKGFTSSKRQCQRFWCCTFTWFGSNVQSPRIIIVAFCTLPVVHFTWCFSLFQMPISSIVVRIFCPKRFFLSRRLVFLNCFLGISSQILFEFLSHVLIAILQYTGSAIRNWYKVKIWLDQMFWQIYQKLMLSGFLSSGNLCLTHYLKLLWPHLALIASVRKSAMY